jgi:hypothetical protein
MDDLRMLGALLAKPDPSGDVVERGREQLTKAIHGPVRQHKAVRHRRAVWLTGGLGLAAAVTAVAVGVASGAAGPTARRGSVPAAGSGTATAQPSARQILLAAASTAQAQPAGTYWHVKLAILDYTPEPAPKGVVVNNTEEDWVARDGRFWNTEPQSCPGPPGTVVFEAGGGDIPELALPDGYLTYDQAARLPADPAGLRAWLARHGQTGDLIVTDLTNLLWEAVPPGVRAAAFRALAALPGAKNLGPVKGGQSLLIPLAEVPWMKLVVDPKTSLVHSEAIAGKLGEMVVEISQWTNHLPRVVPVQSKSSCH